MKRFGPILILAALATHLLHRSVDAIEVPLRDDPRETLPSVESLELLSLGYGELLADYYWLRALSHYGDKRMHPFNYPNMAPLLRRVLTLDPYFATGYVFAGTALTTNEMDPTPAVELLRQGMIYRPDYWRIPFLFGFNSYYFFGDYRTASEALAVAAKLDGAPEYTGLLATRLAAEAGEPQIGIQLIEALLEDTGDPNLVAELLERRDLLILEVQLDQLDDALADYQRHAGEQATDFLQLVEAGLLEALPTDPLGGAYFIGPDGRSATPNEDQRLRLSPLVKEEDDERLGHR